MQPFWTVGWVSTACRCWAGSSRRSTWRFESFGRQIVIDTQRVDTACDSTLEKEKGSASTLILLLDNGPLALALSPHAASTAHPISWRDVPRDEPRQVQAYCLMFGRLFSGRYKAQLVEGGGDGYLRTACDCVDSGGPVAGRARYPGGECEGKLGESHSGELRRETGRAKGERIVAEELKR
jgi:hypothetical protein